MPVLISHDNNPNAMLLNKSLKSKVKPPEIQYLRSATKTTVIIAEINLAKVKLDRIILIILRMFRKIILFFMFFIDLYMSKK
jgi:hypothetical protein